MVNHITTTSVTNNLPWMQVCFQESDDIHEGGERSVSFFKKTFLDVQRLYE